MGSVSRRGDEISPIFIDSREGSRELISSIPNGILVELEFGDAMFDGNGPDGRVQIGVERKRIDDLINSIISGRLSGHQLPGMLESYWKSYLIIEGIWRPCPFTGEVEVRRKEWRKLDRGKRVIMAKDVYAYLTTLEMITGISIRMTTSLRFTALMILWLYGWWNKSWDDHRAHLTIHKQPPPAAWLRIGKPSLVRRAAVELPGVGFKRAGEVEKRFKTLKELVEAREEDWREIEGIGKITAREVVRMINKGG